jgi:hypothetical protein
MENLLVGDTLMASLLSDEEHDQGPIEVQFHFFPRNFVYFTQIKDDENEELNDEDAGELEEALQAAPAGRGRGRGRGRGGRGGNSQVICEKFTYYPC